MFYQETVKIFIAFIKSVTDLKIQTPAASQLVSEVRLITNYYAATSAVLSHACPCARI